MFNSTEYSVVLTISYILTYTHILTYILTYESFTSIQEMGFITALSNELNPIFICTHIEQLCEVKTRVYCT